jgi:hypothetical protein
LNQNQEQHAQRLHRSLTGIDAMTIVNNNKKPRAPGATRARTAVTKKVTPLSSATARLIIASFLAFLEV